MTYADRIQGCLQRLPSLAQAEVLDFVEYLVAKVEHGSSGSDTETWSDLSLASAMRGMEDEPVPRYSHEDLKAVFS